MIEDLRLGLRMLWRRRRASALAIVVLALGIGLATAMFSVLDGVLLRGLPFPDGDRIAMVSTYRGHDRPTPKEDFLALREQPRVFAEVAAFRTYNSVITRPGVRSKGFTATYVTGNLFDLLGVEPILGRGFVPADEDPGSPAVAVLSHKVWQIQFGGDPGVIGKLAVLNRESMTIVGVMPEGFYFPIRQEAWAALRWQGRPWSDAPVFVIAKLRPGMRPDRAALELAPWAIQLDRERPLDGARQVFVRGFVDANTSPAIQRALRVLFAAVLGILLIACANTASLRVGETLARQHELRVRRALGAGSFRLLRLLVAEAMVLTGLGTAAGLLVAQVLVRLASTWLLQGSMLVRQFWIDVRLDPRACVFAAGMAAVAVLLGGLLPAAWSLVGNRLRLTGRSTRGPQEIRLAHFLVTAEVAVCFSLVLGAGLLVMSGLALLAPRPGYDSSHLMRTLINPYQADFETAESRRFFWDRLLVDLEAEPAVQGATLASAVPWGRGMSVAAVRVNPADPTPAAELPQVRGMRVLPGFFAMLRLPLLAGRGFERGDVLAREEDNPGELPVVVSESFARRHFAGSPLGRSFTLEAIHGDPRPIRGTVVGMVADRGLGRRDQPGSEDAIYTPFSFAREGGLEFLLVRGRGTNSGLMRRIDHAIGQINPLVATLDAQTFEQARVEQTWVERRLAQLFALFAILSLVLSGVGLYGAIILSLGHRRRELAIRAALGALPGALRNLILRQGGQSVAWGILLGAGLAWWTGSFLERFLYQIAPWDPRVTVTALFAVAVVSMTAMHGPITSAARTDPAAVLHSE